MLLDFICGSSDDEKLQQYGRSYTPVIRSLTFDDFLSSNNHCIVAMLLTFLFSYELLDAISKTSFFDTEGVLS